MDYLDHTADRPLKSISYKPLKKGTVKARVCIVGAGLAGLSTAFQLASHGVRDIVVQEGSDIARGASGLNGGFLCNDYSLPYPAIKQRYGYDTALELRSWAHNAKANIRKLITSVGIPCGPLMPGSIEVCFDAQPGQCRDFQDKEKMLREEFGMGTHYIDAKTVKRLCSSDRYSAGIFHRDSFQFHTPNYVRGLAKYLARNGVKIYEHSPAIEITKASDSDKVSVEVNPSAKVEAEYAVMACNQNIDGIVPPSKRSYTIDYVLVTEPLSLAQRNKIFKNPFRSRLESFAVFDSRDRCSYYRILPDKRLMWGANFGDSSARSEDNFIELVLNDMRKTYAHLDKINIASAWSGAIEENTQTDMPRIRRHADRIFEASAFGGEGLIATMTAGDLIASAIVENDQRYRVLENHIPAEPG